MELLQSAKDDAELAMIVDLQRNDLGRVCTWGSVRVAESKRLETHPTIHHLSARIEGDREEAADAVTLLRAAFPCGSVTGAPKIRAMEIIDELEPTRRGAYTGAFGWIGFDGDLNLSVSIRVLQATRTSAGTHVSFQVGGAIVADSDPEAEYEETLVKARGMMQALRLRP
jgi:para-aminobenzoate synthetase component 1